MLTPPRQYAELQDLLPYLDQLEEPTNAQEVVLTQALQRATGMLDAALNGVVFADYPATATARTFFSYGGPYLTLPAHQAGSVSVVALGSTVVPSTSYTVLPSGSLLLVASTYGGWQTWNYGAGGVVWQPGTYTVTAKWGYGPPTPAIVELTLELAVNIWRSRDRGMFQEVLGAGDGAALRYVGGLTSQQRAIIESIRDQYREITV